MKHAVERTKSLVFSGSRVPGSGRCTVMGRPKVHSPPLDPLASPDSAPPGWVAPAWLWVGVAVVQRSRPALKALEHSRLLRWVVGSRPLNGF